MAKNKVNSNDESEFSAETVEKDRSAEKVKNVETDGIDGYVTDAEHNTEYSAEYSHTQKDAHKSGQQKAGQNTTQKATKSKNPISSIILFVKQIIDELRKVTTPTKDELIEYTIVVLVFVVVIMLFITGLDFLIGKGIMALFAKN